MKLEIDLPKHQYNNIMALDSINLGRSPYKGIIMYAINAIKRGKALEQEPRKGHWIVDTHKIRAFGSKNETHDYSVHCDKCNYAWDYTTDEEGSLVSNFCPNCGAKMEGKNGNDKAQD